MSGLTSPRILYGVHSISPRRRSDGLPYGILKVIGKAGFSLTSDLEKLYAGSNKFPWAAENKIIETEIVCKVKALPDFLFSLFLGASVTENGADAAGNVTTLTNLNGTSLVSATTGIASLAVKAAKKAELKFGKYVAKVLTSTTIGIFAQSDIDLNRGTAVGYLDDTLQLSLSTITIASGAGTDVDTLGLTFTGGSGTIGMTVGDTATFEIRPPSSASVDIVIGQNPTTFPAFAALMLAQKRSTGEMFEVDAPNCVGSGLPLDMEENIFAQPELKMVCLYDQTLNKVMSIRHIIPT